MTRDRHDELFAHCADVGIDVQWADLGEYLRGFYRHEQRRIVLDRRLSRQQVTATLAHEIGHWRFSDTCSTPANERRAWEYGAAMIITPDEYQRAEQIVGHHLAALAIELGVTPPLIEAWRRWWRTRGQFLDRESLRRLIL